jgi:hypothetical protein
VEAWRLKIEPWRFYRLVVAGSHHFEEELDPDLQICNPEQNLQFEKMGKKPSNMSS